VLAGAPDGWATGAQADDVGPDEAWKERLGPLAAGKGRVLLVAEDGGLPVGCGGALLAGDGSASVVSLWTAPAHRGRGIATEVLLAIERWAEQRGIHRLVLEVVEGNHAAESLYAQAGFRRTGSAVPSASDPNVRVIEMERRLPGPSPY
jgi:RimJ/RimL family protein N-acetyltransferase